MSLEAAIADLTKAVNANTAALQAASGISTSGGTSPASTSTKAEKPAATKSAKADKSAATGPKHDRSEVNAAVNEVRESLGIEAAKGLLKDNGYAKLAEVEEKDFDKLYDAAKALLTAGDGGESDDGL